MTKNKKTLEDNYTMITVIFCIATCFSTNIENVENDSIRRSGSFIFLIPVNPWKFYSTLKMKKSGLCRNRKLANCDRLKTMTHIHSYVRFFLRVTRNPNQPLQFGISTVFLPYHGLFASRLQMQFTICTHVWKIKIEKVKFLYLPSIFGLWHLIQVPWLAWCWLNWFINKSAILGTARSFLMVMVDGFTS